MEEELLAVYAASRTMFRRGSDGGLEQVVRPRIVGAMQRELRSLDILEHWIEENVGSAYLPEARSLGDLVGQARDDLVTHRPSGAADGSSPTAAIIEHLPGPVRETVSARIEADAVTLYDKTVSRTVDEVLGTALAALSGNVDYGGREEVRSFFDVLLLEVTRFVVSRYNLSKATFPGSPISLIATRTTRRWKPISSMTSSTSSWARGSRRSAGPRPGTLAGDASMSCSPSDG